RPNRPSRLPRRLRATASATMRSTSTASPARCGSTTKRRGPNLSTSGRSSLGTSARATRARAFASVRSPTSTPATVTPRATVCARDASFLDVDEDLSDLSVPDAGRHPLPTAGRFAAAASRAGIGEGVFVVAYGNGGGAERLWWLLRHFGHDDCAVVDVGSWHGPLTAG